MKANGTASRRCDDHAGRRADPGLLRVGQPDRLTLVLLVHGAPSRLLCPDEDATAGLGSAADGGPPRLWGRDASVRIHLCLAGLDDVSRPYDWLIHRRGGRLVRRRWLCDGLC